MTTIARMFTFIAMAAIAVACASVDVLYDYELDADFSGYESWDWLPEEPDSTRPEGVNEALAGSRLLDKRIRAAVEEEMLAKDFDRYPEEPDLWAIYHIVVKDKSEFNMWGRTYMGQGGRWDASRNVDGFQYKEGTIVVDLIDRRRDEMVWRGIVTGNVEESGSNPEKADEKIRDVIHRMFRNYPPPD
jgi:hypothetical protein